MRLRPLLTLAYLALAVTAYLGIDGHSLVWIAVCVTLLSVAARSAEALRPHGRLNPLIFWEIGYLFIVAPESQWPAASIVVERGEGYLEQTIRLLIGGHALVVLAAESVQAISRRRKTVELAGFLYRPLPIAASIFVFIAALVFWVPGAVQYGLRGRVAEVDAGGSSAFSAVALAAALISPLLFAHVMQGKRRPLAMTFVLSSPVLVAAVLSGSRFYLLFAALSPIAYLALAKRINIRGGAVLIVLLLGLGAISSLTLSARSSGFGNLDARQLVSPSTYFGGIVHEEAVVGNATHLVSFFDQGGYRGGNSAKAVAFVFVPKAFWPAKPALLGYWFPRVSGGAFSAGHSVSFAYIGEGYSDAGTWGAILEALLLGILLGVIQAFARRPGLPGAAGLIGAISYPASYFAVRSPITTLVVVTGMLILLLIPALVSRWVKGAVRPSALEESRLHPNNAASKR